MYVDSHKRGKTMKWINKVLYLILTIVLMGLLTSTETVFASVDNEPIISVKDQTGKAGEEVEVEILVKNNPGIAGATLQVIYDSKLTLLKVVNGDALEGLAFTKPEKFTSPCKFLWDSESGMSKKDGIIFKLQFLISNQATSGEVLPVQISYADGDVFDENLENVVLKLIDGKITVGNSDAEVCNHDHLDKWKIVEEAGCETTGKKKAACLDCGEIIYEVIDALKHNYVESNTKDPTCTEPGIKTYTCTVCEDKKTEKIPLTGHAWNSWKTVSRATVFASEKQTRSCDKCGKQETKFVGEKLTPTITLNDTSLILKIGQSYTVKVSGLANGDSVKSWKSSNEKIVKVDSKGRITAQKTVGTAYITIILASKKDAKIKVIVNKSAVKTKSITGLKKSITLTKGKTFTLKPVHNPVTSTETFSFASSNKKIVAVSSKGLMKAMSAGKAYVTVKCGSAKFVVTVTVPKTSTSEISNVPKNISIKKGGTYTIKPKIVPSNSDDKIIYKTSNGKVASISSKGVIKGIAKGKAVITVTSGSKSVKCTVTVK